MKLRFPIRFALPILLSLGLCWPLMAQEPAAETQEADKAPAAAEESKPAEESKSEDAKKPEKAEDAQKSKDVGDICEGGVAFDDGTVDTGYGFVPSAKWGAYVQRFETSLFPSREIEKVCVCLYRSITIDEADFEVVFYEDQGGRPAAEPYASAPGRAEDLPFRSKNAGRFYPVDIKDVTLKGDVNYIGIRWNPSVADRVVICADKGEKTKSVPTFQKEDRAKGWDHLQNSRDWIFEDFKALMLRVKAKDSPKDAAKKDTPENAGN